MGTVHAFWRWIERKFHETAPQEDIYEELWYLQVGSCLCQCVVTHHYCDETHSNSLLYHRTLATKVRREKSLFLSSR